MQIQTRCLHPHVVLFLLGLRVAVCCLKLRHGPNRARKSRTTLQNKVRLKVLPEQLTLFVNTSVTFKKCIIQ